MSHLLGYENICNTLLIGVVIYVLSKIAKAVDRHLKSKRTLLYTQHFHDRFKKYIGDLLATLPETSLPPERMEKILRADVKSLKSMLENGEVTSEQLVNIFTKRACTTGN